VDKEMPSYIVDGKYVRIDGNYGDHLAYYNNQTGLGYKDMEYKANTVAWRETSYAEVGTAFTAYSCMILAEMAEEITRRLRFDKRSAQRIVLLVEWHDRPIEPTHKAVRRVLNAMGEEALRQLLAVKRADASACHPDYAWQMQQLDAAEAVLESLLAQETCFTLRDLAVDGRDLMALGLRGKEIGRTLDELLMRVAEGELPNEKAALLAWVEET
jgi:hypothetical protein